MASSSAAQDEFDALFNKTGYSTGQSHPEDRSRSSNTTPHVSRSPSPAQSFLNLDDDDDDEDNTAADLAVKTMRGNYYIPRGTRQANTGPKGVIADAQAFEQARRQAQSIRSVARQPRYSSSNSRSPPQTFKTSDDEKLSEDDEDGEGFMESWRQKRLLELNNSRATAAALGRSGKKTYGDLRRVDAEGFLNAVENSPAETVVIVLINDHTSEISNLVEEATRELARTYTTSRFIKLHYTEAEFEAAGVPAILAYRGGDKFAGFVPVSDEIPDNEELSARSLGALLQRHQVL